MWQPCITVIQKIIRIPKKPIPVCTYIQQVWHNNMCFMCLSRLFALHFANLWWYYMSPQELFQKLKAASSRKIKGYFFPIKNYWRAPLISAISMFIAYLLCFWWNQFLKKITFESRMQFWPRITPAPPEWYMLFQEFVVFNIFTCSMFFKHT